MRLIWPCYENENMGRATFGDWSGSQALEQVCGWNRYYCARGRTVLRFKNLKWRASRVLFGLGEKKTREKREKVFGGTQVRLRGRRWGKGEERKEGASKP